jgi:sulfur relay (sulfurtransferase) complex TusBCD TusD component (DsrE family)
MANQKLPDGYYHLDRMIDTCARQGADIGCCGTCMDVRGITESTLTKGARLHPGRARRLGPGRGQGHHLLTWPGVRW